VALANILGAGICISFSGAFARIALIRPAIMLPIVLAIIFVGALQGARSWGDFYSLILFGILGWIMKRIHWPRPPFVVGFVLGGLLERYLYISVTRFGAEWLLKPIVIVIFALALWGLGRPLIRHIRSLPKRTETQSPWRRPRIDVSGLFYVGLVAVIVWMMVEAYQWGREARTAPVIIGWFVLVALIGSLVNHVFRFAEIKPEAASRVAHLDITADDAELGRATIAKRALRFAFWMIALLASTAVIGLLPSAAILVFLYMRLEGKEAWVRSSLVASAMAVAFFLLFDRVLALPWPHSLLGDWFPILRQVVPSM
jgi:hypothetical protein